MKFTQQRILVLSTFAAIMLLGTSCIIQAVFTMLSVNDPRPLYYAMDPHSYLYTWERERYKGFSLDVIGCEHAVLAFSPFGQGARDAFNLQFDGIPIGDLNGRWNMPGLLYGPIPDGKALSPTLQAALENLFPGVAPGTLNDPKFIDVRQEFGFFTIPVKYDKRGLRFNFEIRLFGGFGFIARAGIADICQRLSEVTKRIDVRPDCCPLQCCSGQITEDCSESTEGEATRRCCVTVDDGICPPEFLCGIATCLIPGFHNLTCRAKTSSDCSSDTMRCIQPSGVDACGEVCTTDTYDCPRVNKFLMQRLPLIAQELNRDLSKFHEISPEDIQLSLFWRQAFEINRGRAGWPSGLVIPYLEFGGTIATGKPFNPRQFMSLPFGNNGHDSIGAIGGIQIDFTNSIIFGSHVGVIHFFSHEFCDYPVPTSLFQSGIYPFTTDVKIKPGLNWQWAFELAAYQFLERFSFWFEYIVIHHEEDDITLLHPDPAFKPELLEDISCWKVDRINLALNYDISPHINLGILFQIPTQQRHAYKSSTVLFSFNAIF